MLPLGTISQIQQNDAVDHDIWQRKLEALEAIQISDKNLDTT